MSSPAGKAQLLELEPELAEAAALSKGEQSLLSSALTENALVDVNQQIADEIASGAMPAITFQADSMNILQAPDPADPSLTIEVQEDGTKTVTTQANQNSAPSTQSLAFHGTFWLRKSSSGRFQIADQQIQILPASPLPAIGLVATALVAVAIVIILAVAGCSNPGPWPRCGPGPAWARGQPKSRPRDSAQASPQCHPALA